MNMYLKSVVCGANIPLLHRKKDQTVPVICLSLLCPTLPGWWWVEIIKGVWPQQHALGEGYLPCMGDGYCKFARLCSIGLMKEIACPCRRELPCSIESLIRSQFQQT